MVSWPYFMIFHIVSIGALFAFVYLTIFRNILFPSVPILFCGLFVPIFRPIKLGLCMCLVLILWFLTLSNQGLSRIHTPTRSSFDFQIPSFDFILIVLGNLIGPDRSFFHWYSTPTSSMECFFVPICSSFKQYAQILLFDTYCPLISIGLDRSFFSIFTICLRLPV